MMRRLAVEMNIPFVTTMSGAKMEVLAIKAMKVDLVPMGQVIVINRRQKPQ